MQRLQHQAVAPEGDDDVGRIRVAVAVNLSELGAGGLRFRRAGGDEG